ncbi:MAG: hypothetical protein V4736_10375 [Bdellovibrionota bacterium]
MLTFSPDQARKFIQWFVPVMMCLLFLGAFQNCGTDAKPVEKTEAAAPTEVTK